MAEDQNDYREAAYMIAIQRVVEAKKIRGDGRNILLNFDIINKI